MAICSAVAHPFVRNPSPCVHLESGGILEDSILRNCEDQHMFFLDQSTGIQINSATSASTSTVCAGGGAKLSSEGQVGSLGEWD